MKKTLLALAAAPLLLLAAACTPAQIATFERLSGSDIPRRTEKVLLDAPNAPWQTPWGIIETSGAVTPLPTAPAGSACPQFFDEALAAGWSTSQWSTIDYIMWRESRCTPSARSSTRDSGLMQINDVHLSWLDDYGIYQSSLYDPTTNLRAGKLLYNKATAAYGCGWQPWVLC